MFREFSATALLINLDFFRSLFCDLLRTLGVLLFGWKDWDPSRGIVLFDSDAHKENRSLVDSRRWRSWGRRNPQILESGEVRKDHLLIFFYSFIRPENFHSIIFNFRSNNNICLDWCIRWDWKRPAGDDHIMMAFNEWIRQSAVNRYEEFSLRQGPREEEFVQEGVTFTITNKMVIGGMV